MFSKVDPMKVSQRSAGIEAMLFVTARLLRTFNKTTWMAPRWQSWPCFPHCSQSLFLKRLNQGELPNFMTGRQRKGCNQEEIQSIH